MGKPPRKANLKFDAVGTLPESVRMRVQTIGYSKIWVSPSEMDFYIAGGNISAIAQCDVQEAHQEKGQHRIDSKKESKRSPF